MCRGRGLCCEDYLLAELRENIQQKCVDEDIYICRERIYSSFCSRHSR